MDFDQILEAHVLFALLALAGAMLLFSWLGISPMDDWHTGLALALTGGASGMIGVWMWRDW